MKNFKDENIYNDFFDEDRQEEMRNMFLEIGKKGIYKSYKKNEIIKINNTDNFYIVMEGKIKQSIYSKEGEEKILYILQPGEIFGEMEYFCEGDSHFINGIIEPSTISIINKNVMENILDKDSYIYKYIIHSITRKFRILMFQMANMTFSDSYGKVADTLIRLSSQESNGDRNVNMVNERLTHEEIAKLIGCSRVSVTRALNEFKKKQIIDIKMGKIIIRNEEALSKYVKWK
ncbi:Crp/Fnr family transcriptional regulator [Anaerosalibacter bizertensis]|uniref:Crp/Fnr family transcriptional regulator n=1 Tax=Anaerosalibacter bizertensis TaxID=932217 RepID=A0A844FJ73_9FIRM|nr:Crp/Fnr family transcriptional regulator [Anaerosalibacter bizertensis]MSS43966.1 Crp/Fnr family transcriptional regulator [Anaerosalibacter bizertensis]